MQENQQNTQRYEEDEIDLRELFRTLIKNKIKIIVLTAVITILGVIYAYLKTPIYEVKSNIQVGFIGDEQTFLESPDAIVKKLNILFEVESSDKTTKVEKFVSEVSSISQNKKLKNYIEVKTVGISNEEALKKNKEVLEYLQEVYKPKIDLYINNTMNAIEDTKREIVKIDEYDVKNIKQNINIIKNQRIVNIDDKIKVLKEYKLKSIDAKINFHNNKLKEYTIAINKLYQDNKKNNDTASVTILSIQMVNYQNLILNSQNEIEDLKIERKIIDLETIPDLERQKKNLNNDDIRKLEYQIDVTLQNKKLKLKEKIEDLEYKISKLNVRNSSLVGKYIIHDYPVKPKKKLIVVVAFVTGFILSIFLVFFLEFIKSFRKEEKE